MSLRILSFFTLLLIEAIYSAEQDWIWKERVKRDGGESDELLNNMVETENSDIYKPVNELLDDVKKMQESWTNVDEMMMKSKNKLKISDSDERMFDDLWKDWTKANERAREVCDEYGCRSLLVDDFRDDKCEPHIFNLTEQNHIKRFYEYAILNIAKPLDDFSKHQNQTLKDLIPLINIMKDVITLRLKSCDIKEKETCKENIKKWTLEGTIRYKSRIANLNPVLNEIITTVETVWDNVRKFKYDYFKMLNQKKINYLCCQQNAMLSNGSACLTLLDKNDSTPIKFGAETS